MELIRGSQGNLFMSEKIDHSQDLVYRFPYAPEITVVHEYSGCFFKCHEEPSKQSALRHSGPHEEIKTILENSSVLKLKENCGKSGAMSVTGTTVWMLIYMTFFQLPLPHLWLLLSFYLPHYQTSEL